MDDTLDTNATGNQDKKGKQPILLPGRKATIRYQAVDTKHGRGPRHSTICDKHPTTRSKGGATIRLPTTTTTVTSVKPRLSHTTHPRAVSKTPLQSPTIGHRILEGMNLQTYLLLTPTRSHRTAITPLESTGTDILYRLREFKGAPEELRTCNMVSELFRL